MGRRLGLDGHLGGDRQRRILRQDGPLELAQPLARLDTELLDERPPGVLVGLERVRLPVAPVQRQHELRARALAVRMLGGEPLKGWHDLSVAAERKFGLDQLLEGAHPQLIQPANLELGELLIRKITERRAAPQRERRLERRGGMLRTARGELASALGEELLKPMRIEAVWVESQPVAVLAGLDQFASAARQVAGERPPQPRDADLQRLHRAGLRALSPELVDQPVGRQRLVAMQEKQRQERPLLGARDRDHPALVEDLERSKDAEVHTNCAGRAPGRGQFGSSYRSPTPQTRGSVAVLLPRRNRCRRTSRCPLR